MTKIKTSKGNISVGYINQFVEMKNKKKKTNPPQL